MITPWAPSDTIVLVQPGTSRTLLLGVALKHQGHVPGNNKTNILTVQVPYIILE